MPLAPRYFTTTDLIWSDRNKNEDFKIKFRIGLVRGIVLALVSGFYEFQRELEYKSKTIACPFIKSHSAKFLLLAVQFDVDLDGE